MKTRFSQQNTMGPLGPQTPTLPLAAESGSLHGRGPDTADCESIMLYMIATVVSFIAASDAARAAAAASAAAWPSGKRNLPLTKNGLCQTNPSMIGGGVMSLSFDQYSAPWGRA